MEFAYEPPKYFENLAPKKAARTQLGWGVGEDGSIDLEHVMSSNPFAGKTHNWGIAQIDQNGDIIIQSKGPGNAESKHQIPQELIQRIVEFYEKEGLNVRNISEKTADFTDEHLSPSLTPDAPPEGMCPVCHSSEVYGVPGSPFVDCDECGWHGDSSEVLDAHHDPDPPDSESYNYNQDFITDAAAKESGASLQGAPVLGTSPAQGFVIRPDMQSEDEVLALLETKGTTPHEQQERYVDERNKGQGTSFPTYDNPYTNRGGSLTSEKIEDHFIEEQPDPKEAADPVGIPSTGPSDPRNFNNPLSVIVVAKNLITDHNWAYMGEVGKHCKGMVTEFGGPSSHAALVAGGLNLPLITGVPVDGIHPGDQLRMDPATGTVDVNGGSTDVQVGDTTLKKEAVRFVWSHGNHMETPWGEPNLDTHVQMIMKMEAAGQLTLDPETFEPVDATRGVIYDNGDGEYYDPISDEDAMNQWVRSAFPQCKTMVYKPTGSNYQVASKEAEITDKAPQCSNCGSHSYKPLALPSKADGKGEGLLKCLNCGEEYKHELYRNPKKSELEKLAPGKEHMKGVSPKRNRMYEDIKEQCLADGGSEEHCKEMAARTVNKYRSEHGETKSSDEHEAAKPTFDQDAYEEKNPRTSPETQECPYCGELYTNTVKGWQEHKETCSGRDEMPDSMKNRETKVADTDGNPLESGKVYLMHSVKYKVPDIVQLVRVEPHGIEAHIESDVNGSFPILISEDEFDSQGYSFEPYTAANEALPFDFVSWMRSDESHKEERMDRIDLWLQGAEDQELEELWVKSNGTHTSKLKLSAHKIHLTPRRQQELINENPKGRARNYDKLNLDGTHYQHEINFEISLDDLGDHFLF